MTDISDIYRRNTGRIIDCVGDGLCPCEIIAVVQMLRICGQIGMRMPVVLPKIAVIKVVLHYLPSE